MIRLDDLQVFVYAARDGSFSAAARQLDISPALASSAVQRLERALGVRLFIRSTRSMRLSGEGERYLVHAEATLDAVAAGHQALARDQQEIAGALRLSMPSDLGRNLLHRWLDDFQAAHPKLTLHLRISDQTADLFRQSVDAGIRYGLLADSSLVSLPLVADNRRALCAAPAYLARHGHPASLADLRHHNCLRFVIGEQTYERWTFFTPEGEQTVTVSGDRISDDADMVRRWGVAGHGILYKSRLDVLDDLHAGRLVELCPASYGQPVPLQLVTAHRSALTPAVQLLRSYLSERFQTLLATHPVTKK